MNITYLKLLLASASAVFLLAEASAKPIASVEYFYAADGTLTGRAVNGKLQQYQYDKKGQLVAVVDALSRRMVEHYVYDPAGNILSKTVNEKTTTYIYDKANQLISSTCEGKVTKYQYDAAGRMVKEGEKSYYYGYLDKILEIQENGRQVAAFDYHMDGQIASAMYGDKSEDFLWDGLALIHRGATNFINEPYVTGGNPILSSKDGVMFNDMLGNSLNIGGRDIVITAFGETESVEAMFTGKPYIGELGYSFLFRNYRADQGKWQTTDPLGYPDGWNNLAYCENQSTTTIDIMGLCREIKCWDANGRTYYETVHDVKHSVDQEYEVRGAQITTLGVTCGTGTRSETIVDGSASFSFSPQAFGFALGSFSWNSSYSQKTIELDFSCSLPAHSDHKVYGQKIVDYYVCSSMHIVAKIYECGLVKIISQTPNGKAYIDGVLRKNTKCKE